MNFTTVLALSYKFYKYQYSTTSCFLQHKGFIFLCCSPNISRDSSLLPLKVPGPPANCYPTHEKKNLPCVNQDKQQVKAIQSTGQ